LPSTAQAVGAGVFRWQDTRSARAPCIISDKRMLPAATPRIPNWTLLEEGGPEMNASQASLRRPAPKAPAPPKKGRTTVSGTLRPRRPISAPQRRALPVCSANSEYAGRLWDTYACDWRAVATPLLLIVGRFVAGAQWGAGRWRSTPAGTPSRLRTRGRPSQVSVIDGTCDTFPPKPGMTSTLGPPDPARHESATPIEPQAPSLVSRRGWPSRRPTRRSSRASASPQSSPMGEPAPRPRRAPPPHAPGEGEPPPAPP